MGKDTAEDNSLLSCKRPEWNPYRHDFQPQDCDKQVSVVGVFIAQRVEDRMAY